MRQAARQVRATKSSRANRRALAPPPLHRDQALFLDFDGTLVEIAQSPSLVRVPAELPELLRELTSWLDGAVAVVSGRPLDELARMLAPFHGGIAGDHGLERRLGDGTVTRCLAHHELDRFRPLVAGFAARHNGVLLEDKGGSLALHYRQSPALAARCRALVRRAAQASNGALATIAGKMVVELIPQSAGKGRAIAGFLADPPFRGRLPVFVGDDITDEDGFAVVNRTGGVSVHVGGGATIAHHNLATVGDVLAWLTRGLAG
jgi:trehalose 6-phosphate phosphatase